MSKQLKLFEWEFDNYKCGRWAKIRNGDLEGTRSWVEYGATEDGQRISVFTEDKNVFVIDTYRDQWGTYITLCIDKKTVTIAQEDGTKSFMAGFLAALTKMQKITDIDSKEPILTKSEINLTQEELEDYFLLEDDV